MAEPRLQFAAFQPSVDPSFWQTFTKKKLDEWKLEDVKLVPISCEVLNAPSKASFTYRSFENTGSSTNFDFSPSSRGAEEDKGGSSSSSSGANSLHAVEHRGFMKAMNTIEDFKRFEIKDVTDAADKHLWKTLKSGNLSTPCVFVVFGDLKKYDFFYAVGFPSVQPPSGFGLKTNVSLAEAPENLGLKEDKDVKDLIKKLTSENKRCVYDWKKSDGENNNIHVYRDSSTFNPNNLNVFDLGFRNFLTSLWLSGKKNTKDNANSVEVLVLRSNLADSRLITVYFKDDENSFKETENCPPKCMAPGWVKNIEAKSMVHTVNLGQWLDPAAIAQSAVDLNIKLMKWRLVPDLQPEKIQNLKYLMLGSGTLGCQIARNLMGWGVRYISFLDSGVVNYSNPVRQCLFTHKDAATRQRKAETAFNRAKEVMPELEGGFYDLEIPMPGHPHSYNEKMSSKSGLNNLYYGFY